MKIEVRRKAGEYPDRTLGELFIDGVHFCFTLEDQMRPPGEKVYGQTAIPCGSYKTVLAPFRGDESKIYPHLLDVPMFTGICIHGGNVPEDTLGCILVGFNRDDGRIYNSAVRVLVEKMKESGQTEWIVDVKVVADGEGNEHGNTTGSGETNSGS